MADSETPPPTRPSGPTKPNGPGAAPNSEYSLEYYRSQMVILLAREKELQETQRHLQRVVSTLMSLQKISRFLKNTSSLDEGLMYVLRALATETNYERAVIMLEGGGSPRVFTEGYSAADTQALSGISEQALDEFLRELQATKESGFLIQVAQSQVGRAVLPVLQFDTCLLALISNNEKVTGFIAAGYSPAQAVYFAPVLKLQKDDTVWFDELAHQISATIVNLSLLDNLKDEQARLSASINSLVLGFMIVDLNHNVVFSNKAVGTVLAVDRITTMRDVASRFTGIDVLDLGSQAVAQKTPIEIKEVLYGKRILRLFFGPIIKDLNVIGYIFLVEDITEAKSMERSREEFFSIASHELRTPLTAIRGNSSLMLDYYPMVSQNAELKELVNDIHGSSERLIKIVNDFLQVSRLEQGRLVFHLTAVDAVKVLKQAITELQPLANAKKLALTASPLPAAALVMADADRLKEVIINLISNAINYTRAGSVGLELSQRPDAVTVRVRDTGVGIPQRNQSLLFRKFQQAGDTLARDNTQSTGLGLYISKLMVEAMKGTIQLEESVPDKGSVFSFTLPAAPAAGSPQPEN
jgi:signal transduction histidine kinase